MHEANQPQRPDRDASQPQPVEQEPSQRPKIYVASLSDYNAGVLHGSWLSAAVEVEELWTGIQAMLASSPSDPAAEEWAIHDYEGFHGLPLGEWEPLERVAKVARGIAEHGEAFAAWVSSQTLNDEQLEAFDEHYVGCFDDLDDLGEHVCQDWLGVNPDDLAGVPELLQPYTHVDIAALARDMVWSGELITAEGDEGLHVFWP